MCTYCIELNDSTKLSNNQIEPSLNELFDDPIMQVLMARDAVRERDLRGLIDRVRQNYDGGRVFTLN